jgi:hypothetical protein
MLKNKIFRNASDSRLHKHFLKFLTVRAGNKNCAMPRDNNIKEYIRTAHPDMCN